MSFALAWFDESSKHEGLRAFVEPFVILLILVLNATVGVWQESRSEAALDALKELQSEHTSVLRNGKQVRGTPLLASWQTFGSLMLNPLCMCLHTQVIARMLAARRSQTCPHENWFLGMWLSCTWETECQLTCV